jgi:hypothetical protein
MMAEEFIGKLIEIPFYLTTRFSMDGFWIAEIMPASAMSIENFAVTTRCP